ncbi:MAG TPA: hypothetical protein VGF25_19710, partial [Thermoleophilaceae bacterium]
GIDAVIDYAKKMQEWPLLEEAVAVKLDEQQAVVAWWDATVAPPHRPQSNADQRYLSVAEAESLTAIQQQTISRWRTRLADRAAYRQRRLGADAVEAVLAMGRDLIAAKTALHHGGWERMFAGHPEAVKEPLVFSVSTARRLVLVAEHKILSNRAHAHALPPSWFTLYELTKLDDAILEAALADGRITPALERKDVRQQTQQPRGASGRRLFWRGRHRGLPPQCGNRTVAVSPTTRRPAMKAEARRIQQQIDRGEHRPALDALLNGLVHGTVTAREAHAAIRAMNRPWQALYDEARRAGLAKRA